ncbi:MAG TPA: DUF86 domain-containing protein [Candidatus Bathyarchaeia archaeon]|nr:DUF86 domain-containing protein [Candidatus Bathyarchaeia archaeon]
MSDKRDLATLVDIANAAKASLAFLGEMSLTDFVSDPKTVSSVQHQLMIMGEAVKRLSPECKETLPEVGWTQIARMRDRLIHGYDDVDLDIVWRTVRRNVPQLLEQLERLIHH